MSALRMISPVIASTAPAAFDPTTGGGASWRGELWKVRAREGARAEEAEGVKRALGPADRRERRAVRLIRGILEGRVNWKG